MSVFVCLKTRLEQFIAWATILGTARNGSVMGSTKLQPSSNSPESPSERLDSWKEIAAYLKRDERTVRRWEAEGLPVHRKVHKKQASVFAYKMEIDAWWHSGRSRLEEAGQMHPSKYLILWGVVAAAALLLVIVALTVLLNIGGLGDHLRRNTAAARAIHSLAVLPLENLSKDPEQEYFAQGMTEELTTELAQISALKVISHTSVVRFKETRESMPQIARDLGVDAVIEGAVQRSGDKVEITVQLIEAPLDRHLWAKSYQRSLIDVLALQREVTHAIVDEIQAKLTTPEKVRLANSRAVNSDGYQDYLRGRYLLTTFGEDDARKAIAYFQLAIQKDPSCALAYAGIAEADIDLGQPWVGALPPKDALAQAKEAATTAITIDDSLSEAHSALGHVIELYDWDWQGAEKQYRRALELNSNDANTHFWYGEFLQAMGRDEEGFAQMRQAMLLDPLNSGPIAELASQFRTARQYDDAIRTFHKVFEVEPYNLWAYTGLGWVYTDKRTYSEAIGELEKAVRLSNRNETALASLGKALGDSGRTQEAQKILRELKDRSKHHYVSQYLVALVQLGLGKRDEALASLEQAYSDRDQWILYLNVDPFWDDLRSDHRFQGLLRRVGLENRHRS